MRETIIKNLEDLIMLAAADGNSALESILLTVTGTVVANHEYYLCQEMIPVNEKMLQMTKDYKASQQN